MDSSSRGPTDRVEVPPWLLLFLGLWLVLSASLAVDSHYHSPSSLPRGFSFLPPLLVCTSSGSYPELWKEIKVSLIDQHECVGQSSQAKIQGFLPAHKSLPSVEELNFRSWIERVLTVTAVMGQRCGNLYTELLISEVSSHRVQLYNRDCKFLTPLKGQGYSWPFRARAPVQGATSTQVSASWCHVAI